MEELIREKIKEELNEIRSERPFLIPFNYLGAGLFWINCIDSNDIDLYLPKIKKIMQVIDLRFCVTSVFYSPSGKYLYVNFDIIGRE